MSDIYDAAASVLFAHGYLVCEDDETRVAYVLRHTIGVPGYALFALEAQVKAMREALEGLLRLVDKIDNIKPPEDDTWRRAEEYETACEILAALSKEDA